MVRRVPPANALRSSRASPLDVALRATGRGRRARRPASLGTLAGRRGVIECRFRPVSAAEGNRLAGVRIGRREAVAVTVGVLLLVAAFVVPHLHLGIVTPLINASPARFYSFADTAPIFGWWNAHVGWGTVPAIVIGIAAVLWGQAVALRLPWRALPSVTWATACALGVLAGDDRRLAARLRRPAHRPSRVLASGAHRHRHSRRGAHVRQQNP